MRNSVTQKQLMCICEDEKRMTKGEGEELTADEQKEVEEQTEDLMNAIKNMIGDRSKLTTPLSRTRLNWAFECFSSACSVVYALFQFLQLETDDSMLTKMSLVELNDCNDACLCLFLIISVEFLSSLTTILNERRNPLPCHSN